MDCCLLYMLVWPFGDTMFPEIHCHPDKYQNYLVIVPVMTYRTLKYNQYIRKLHTVKNDIKIQW